VAATFASPFAQPRCYLLENLDFSCYPSNMTITQVKEVAEREPPYPQSADHAAETAGSDAPEAARECPICAAHNYTLKPEIAQAIIEEDEAITRGEVPVKWYTSFDEMLEDLDRDDPDD